MSFPYYSKIYLMIFNILFQYWYYTFIFVPLKHNCFDYYSKGSCWYFCVVLLLPPSEYLACLLSPYYTCSVTLTFNTYLRALLTGFAWSEWCSLSLLDPWVLKSFPSNCFFWHLYHVGGLEVQERESATLLQRSEVKFSYISGSVQSGGRGWM